MSRDVYVCESCGAFYEGTGSCTKVAWHYECFSCGHEWDSAKSPVVVDTCPSCQRVGYVSYEHTERLCGGTLKLYE